MLIYQRVRFVVTPKKIEQKTDRKVETYENNDKELLNS